MAHALAHNPRITRALSLSLLGMLACQQPPDISAELNDYASLLNETNSLACDCPEDLGYSTMIECDQGVGTVGEAQRQCLVDALDGNEDAAKDYLDCANSTLRTFSQCLASDPFCEDGRYDNCDAARMSADDACPQLPSSIQVGFMACIQ